MSNNTAYTAIALPADLSEEIDTVAKSAGLHRSEFVQQLIEKAVDDYHAKKEDA